MGIFFEVWELPKLMNYFFLVLHSLSGNHVVGWMVWMAIEQKVD
jgi:hypothetical protein